ncbi:F0F1 ATP synthase subunit B [Coleofasciculus sp. FACHB-1120]|uniref:F0F1 ATP synthase subunit B n=1 Tax=Coleofasciculus sp. FACHB-1120 TaxID=2692783 RepID=UPI0016821DBC|nr:F0F1 ATP synthase subunit B [Coleofasciculus sp. FACHB-1120]
MGIMGTFFLLAEVAHSAGSELAEAEGHGGFGLNTDIFEANLINLAILIGVLFYFGRKLLGNILSERRSRIETAIREAEQRQKEAAAALSDAQQKLTQAQAEAERIRKDAEESAKAAREAILAKAAMDVERLQRTAVDDVNTERERTIAELRAQVSAMALQRVESQLKSQLDDAVQQQLIDSSIASVGGR